MIPRFEQNSNLLHMSLIGNFDIWEDFGMFNIEGYVIKYFTESRTFDYIKD